MLHEIGAIKYIIFVIMTIRNIGKKSIGMMVISVLQKSVFYQSRRIRMKSSKKCFQKIRMPSMFYRDSTI